MTILILLCALLAAAYIPYRIVFYSPQKGQNDIHNLPRGEQYEIKRERMTAMIDEMAALPYEQVFIRSRDGLKLAGRYYHQKDGAPLALCFHGYRGTAVRDFCGGSQIALSLGQNVLAVDQRAHGLSEGHTISFGVRERWDCLDWIEYATNRFGRDTPIALYGVSMGAATVLLAAGLDLPSNVRCVVADSPYNAPKDIIQKVCRDMKLPPALLYPFISLGARLYGRFRLSGGDVTAAAARAQVPILLIHGEDDRFVPCEMSEAILRAAPGHIRRYTFPHAAHGISLLEDENRYTELVTDFLQENLPLGTK